MKKALIFILLIVIGNNALAQGSVQLVNHSPNCTVRVYLYANAVSYSWPACSLVSNIIFLDVWGSGSNTYNALDYNVFQTGVGWSSGGPVGVAASDFIWTDAVFNYQCPCTSQTNAALGSVGLTTSTCFTTSEALTWLGSTVTCPTPVSVSSTISAVSPAYMTVDFY